MNNLTDKEVQKLDALTRYLPPVELGTTLKTIIDNVGNIQTGSPVNAVKASIDLTIVTQPIAGDTMTIGSKLYTFVADGAEAADGDISVELNLATVQPSIVAAINGTDGINTPHPDVVAGAFAVNKSVISALVGGISGNSISVEETFDANGNVFDDTDLSGGVDGTVGLNGDQYIDNTYIYRAIADNTISDANWRRISLGTAY